MGKSEEYVRNIEIGVARESSGTNMFRKILRYLRYMEITSRIRSQLPKCNPDNSHRYDWSIQFNFHDKFDPYTGEKLKQKSLPSIKIEATRFSFCLVHPTKYNWGTKQIVEERWLRIY